MKTINLKELSLWVMMILVCGLLVGKAHAQKPTDTNLIETIKHRMEKDMQVHFKIYLDDRQLETDAVHVKCINSEQLIDYKVDMTNDFTAYLKQATSYIFIIGHDGFNSKTIEIVTNPPRNERYILEAEVYLYTGKADDYGGKLMYSHSKGRYELIK